MGWPPCTESQALLDDGAGRLLHGREAIRKFFRELVAMERKFQMGEQREAMVCGDLALTSTRLPDGMVTAEIARRQSDGTWLWVIDQFSISFESTRLTPGTGRASSLSGSRPAESPCPPAETLVDNCA